MKIVWKVVMIVGIVIGGIIFAILGYKLIEYLLRKKKEGEEGKKESTFGKRRKRGKGRGKGRGKRKLKYR